MSERGNNNALWPDLVKLSSSDQFVEARAIADIFNAIVDALIYLYRRRGTMMISMQLTEPTWTDPATLNEGNRYNAQDGVTSADMNAIVQNLLYLKANGGTGEEVIIYDGKVEVL